MLVAVLCAVSVMAQTSAGDKVYNEGMALQGKMDCKSQKAAIEKFRKAKKLFDSSAKKSQCDNAIGVSQSIIGQLNCNGPKPPKPNGPVRPKQDDKPKQTVENTTLEVDETLFEISEEADLLRVKVDTNDPSWTIYTVITDGEEPFIEVKKESATHALIKVEKNEGFDSRSQYANIKAGSLIKPITVRQEGSDVNLRVNETAVKFKWKGGDKKLEVSSNYDGSYDENYGANWYVETKPDWIMVSVGQPKKSPTNPLVMVTPITIKCDKAGEGSNAAFVGRRGIIQLRSGKTVFKLEVKQDPK